MSFYIFTTQTSVASSEGEFAFPGFTAAKLRTVFADGHGGTVVMEETSTVYTDGVREDTICFKFDSNRTHLNPLGFYCASADDPYGQWIKRHLMSYVLY